MLVATNKTIQKEVYNFRVPITILGLSQEGASFP